MDPQIYRMPIQIATVNDDASIIWNIDSLRNVLTNNTRRLIKIVVVIGRYQTGKTSLISLITGNNAHVVGQGAVSQTRGATIDGPYEIDYLMNRWNIQSDNLNIHDQSIYFIDVEGYDAFNTLNNEQRQSLVSRLYVPLISISSCIIFLADLNEGYNSITTIIRSMKLFSLAVSIDNDLLCNFLNPFWMLNIVRELEIYENHEYRNPTLENYSVISRLLTGVFRQRFFIDPDRIIMDTKPLPHFDRIAGLFNQNNAFSNGLKYIVTDILQILLNPNGRLNIRNPDQICEIISNICRSIEIYNITFTEEATNDFFERKIIEKLNSLYDSEMLSCFEEILENYISNIRGLSLLDDIDFQEITIGEHLRTVSRTQFNAIIDSNIRREIREIREFIQIKERYLTVKIDDLVTNRINNITNQVIDLIRSSANNCIYEVKILIQEKLEDIIKEFLAKPLLEFIPKDEQVIKHFLRVILTKAGDMYININIKQIYIDNIIEIREAIENLHNEIEQIIENKIKGFVGSLKNKKKLQIFVKCVIAFFITAAAGGGICSGIGAGIVASMAAAGATGAAITGQLGGMAALSFGIGAGSIAGTGFGIDQKIRLVRKDRRVAQRWNMTLNSDDYKELIELANLECLKFLKDHDNDDDDVVVEVMNDNQNILLEDLL